MLTQELKFLHAIAPDSNTLKVNKVLFDMYLDSWEYIILRITTLSLATDSISNFNCKIFKYRKTFKKKIKLQSIALLI